jgi:uncharacterized protein (TIGR02246 family)
MIERAAIFLFSLVVSAPTLAGPAKDALAAYYTFFDRFTSENHDQVADLFAPDALFYGTNSIDLVTTPEGVRQYFVAALTAKRGAVTARRFAENAVVLSDTVVAVSGKWQSERTMDGLMSTAGPSRITVVMHKRGDKWLIAQFHNSPTPRLSQPIPAVAPPR